MTYALLAVTFLALLWCALRLHIAARRPNDTPRWSDVLPFCAALFAAVFCRGTASVDSHAKAKGVVEP